MMAGLMAGCSGDDPQPDVPDSPQEKPGTENPVPGDEVISAGDAGEMEYELGKPDVVEGAGDLQMSISQTSSYTDPDGTVFTCEPKASINVSVRLDTVYAKDFNELIELLEYVKPTYSENGEDPVTHSIDQQFRFGDQTIDLNMDYEVYTYRNSLGQNIGMPYIELREADFGEGGGTSAGEIIRPSVTIRRAEPATRTIEVEDTTAYNVSVHFGVMAAPQNFAGAENKFEIVEFEVQYVGMVPYTDTYPGAELSYRVEDGEGNALEGSEFTVAPGSIFTLNMVQNSSYTDQDGAVSADPVAWTRITTPDTLRIDNADELAGMLDKVVIETSSDELEGNLPYYKLEGVVLDGEVSVAEVSRSEDGKTQVYKAKATYKQKAVPVNIEDGKELEFTYVVEYLGKVAFSGAEHSYSLTDASGNALESTSFTVEPNNAFELNIKQSSSYTDRDGNVETKSPTAWTKITTPDTLRIDNADELAGMLDKVVIETSSDELEGNLPYYKLEGVVLDGEVSVAEVSRSEDGKTQVYKATATYKQKAVPVNIEGGKELEFTYVVEYLGKVSIRLVDVKYEQEVIWEDAHDNIYTNSQVVVTRKATYSDGTVDETKFYSTKNFVQAAIGRDPQDSSGEIEYVDYSRNETINTFITTCATGVPDLDHLSYKHRYADSSYVYVIGYEGPEGNWTEYKHQVTNELYSETEQKEGWYGKWFGFVSTDTYSYVGEKNYSLRNYKIELIYKDRFFCIDGQLFTCDPLEHTHNYSIDTIMTSNRGKCVLVKNEADVTWFGRKFYYAVVDTVYVKQPSAASGQSASTVSRTASATRHSRLDRESRSGSPYVTAPEYQQDDRSGLSLSVETVPGSVPYTEHTRIRPDGTRTTIRREGIVSDISFDVPGKENK